MENTVCLNEQEAAKILGISTKTLQAWRFQNKGPVYVKLGRRIAYPDNDLKTFIHNCRVEPHLTKK